jgi:hypothetical protein
MNLATIWSSENADALMYGGNMQARLRIAVRARYVFLDVHAVEFRHGVLRHHARQDERVAEARGILGARAQMVACNDLVSEVPVLPDAVLRNVCTKLGRDEVPRSACDGGLDHLRLQLQSGVFCERDHDIEAFSGVRVCNIISVRVVSWLTGVGFGLDERSYGDLDPSRLDSRESGNLAGSERTAMRPKFDFWARNSAMSGRPTAPLAPMTMTEGAI